MSSAEEQQMREAVISWGRSRWPDARVMHELAIGGSRIDLAFVTPRSIAGVEIKSSRDTLDRLEGQLKSYFWALPEVWVAFAPKWLPHFQTQIGSRYGQMMVSDGAVTEEIQSRNPQYKFKHEPRIDELMTSPLLHLLWVDELRAVSAAFGVKVKSRMYGHKLRALLSRKLTGDQIITGVCAQLRLRQCGWTADPEIRDAT